MRKKVKDAVEDLKLLAERWDTTKVWHKSLFLEGEIHITTGDLRSIGIVLKHLESLEGKLNLRKISQKERDKGRSETYWQMDARDQWAEDKRNGILDWDGG